MSHEVGLERAAHGRVAPPNRRHQAIPPGIGSGILVGDDPASATYVRMKRARCEKAGIRSRHLALPASTTTAQLVDAVTGLSRDPDVHGILLQHPAGPHIDERAAFEAIAPHKDVDTPVPGGVGPMTIAVLLEQTVDAAARQLGVALDEV